MGPSNHVVPIVTSEAPSFVSSPQPSAYLPDELLLDILSYIWDQPNAQSTLASFCSVNRQWYDVGIAQLYARPFLVGKSYDLFVRTICPSINQHIKKTDLSGLVKELNLSHIVHQGNKSTTARLLGRTKASLEVFVAPQASFAINCWAALSKCSKLKLLDMSLVSECINYQALNQTVRQLNDLTHLYLPRCSSNYEPLQVSMNLKWPPKLQYLHLSGNVRGRFLRDLRDNPQNFPNTLSTLCISHCPGLDHNEIRSLLVSLQHLLRDVELRDIPHIKPGRLNNVLDWVPELKALTISTEYIDMNFGNPPQNFEPTMWPLAKPLERLTLVTNGGHEIQADPFEPSDLFDMIDRRFLGRLRHVRVAKSTSWDRGEGSAELEALEGLLFEVDQDTWYKRRWHYADLNVPPDWEYQRWLVTPQGQRMKPWLRLIKNQ